MEKAWRDIQAKSPRTLYPETVWNRPRMGGKICCHWWLGKLLIFLQSIFSVFCSFGLNLGWILLLKDLTPLQITLLYSNILTQTVKESEKPAHKQTMGLAVSTLRGDDDDDDIIRSVLIIYLFRNKLLRLIYIRVNDSEKKHAGSVLHWYNL